MAQEQPNVRTQSVWERRWRDRIAAWRESGLSQQAFCRAHGLSESTLSHWKSELAKRDAVQAPPAIAGQGTASESAAAGSSGTLRWAEVRWPAVGAEKPEPASASSGFEIVLPRGWSVRLGPGFEAESLRRLLTVLEERSC